MRILPAITLIVAACVCAEDAPPFKLLRDGNWLVIKGAALPGGELRVNYLEAYCRANSADADWVKHTVIPHKTDLVSQSDDGRELKLKCTVSDGVTVEHTITALNDGVSFKLTAHNPGATASEIQWAQCCPRLGNFTGFGENYSRNLDDYLPKCFIFIDGKLKRMPFEPWAKNARYMPGQVFRPAHVPATDVNPRPLSTLTPSNGLIGCFSGDEKLIFAIAFEPYQELFQGVARCLHADVRFAGLKPGETKTARGRIYIVPNDVDALLKKYAADFPEHQPPATKERPFKFEPGQPAPEIDALFHDREPWNGGDGDYSIVLEPNKILWLFSDTFVGAVKDNKRVRTKMVNNTGAIQRGIGADAKMEFLIGSNDKGEPASLLTPKSKGYFWPQAGIMLNGKLNVFLAQIEKTDGKGAFAFKHIDQHLGVIANPLDAPKDWRMDEIALPCSELTNEREISFGSSVLLDGGYLYIYGIDERRVPHSIIGKKMIVARAKPEQIADFSAWKYFKDGEWQADFKNCSPLAEGMAVEYSVSYLPALKRFVAVYTEIGISPRIFARNSTTPWGPWSAPVTLYECPEVKWDKRIFCYTAKAHPELTARDDELIISYVAGSHDFWHVFQDARLYWPRFIRVKLAND